MIPHRLLPCLAPLLLVHAATAAQMTLQPSGDNAWRANISAARPGAIALVEILDAKTGRCVRTLHAGPLGEPREFPVNGRTARLKPGSYRLRYREDIHLVADTELKLPGKQAWVNPVDVALTGKSLFVLDAGLVVTEVVPEQDGKSAVEAVTKGQTCVYKFNRDLSPDLKFGDRGRLIIRESPTPFRSLAADEGGLVYYPDGMQVEAWDGSDDTPLYRIGGMDPAWAPDHYTAKGKNTQEVGGVALGAGPKIYLGILAHFTLRAYDRTRKDFDGFLYSVSAREGLTGDLDRCIASDGEGAIYFADRAGQIRKIEDTGKELKISYASGLEHKICHAMGASASAGIVCVAAHGPGDGPFWDSGGGSEVVFLWDDGSSLQQVARFGSPVPHAEQVQFMNPSAAILSPDHTELWVSEDGQKNEEGPPGSARVRRFKITSARTEEIPFEWRTAK